MKTLLVALVALFTVSATAQSFPISKTDSAKASAYVKAGSDTLDIKYTRFIRIEDRIYTYEQLTKSTPLFVDINYIANLWAYILTSKNGEFTGKDIEQLKAPLIPFIQLLNEQQKQQQAQAPPKK